MAPRRVGRAALAVCLLTALACSGSDDSSPSVRVEESDASTTTAERTTTTTEAPSPTEAARGYFEALATSDVVQMEKMAPLAVEGSPAWLYGNHLTNLTRIQALAEEQRLTTEDDSYVLCTGTGADEQCITYADFVADETGKLSTFTVNGKPLADLIVAGGPEAASSGVAAKVVTAYQSVSGRLFVVLDVRNDTGAPIPPPQAIYLAPGGRQTDSEGSGLFDDIQPGATAQDFAAFPSSQRGGTLILTTYTNDFSDEVRLEVPVP